MKKTALALVSASFAMLVAGCAKQEPAGEAAAPPPPTPAAPTAPTAQAEPPKTEAGGLVGKPAPAFSLKSLDGKTVDLASFKGKPVVLDFWATWCPPCRELAPSVQKLHKEMGDKVAVVGMASDDEAAVRDFVKKEGLTMTQLIADEAVSKAYGVEGIPTTVFIDKDGVVRDVHVGLEPGDSYKPLKDAVDKLL